MTGALAYLIILATSIAGLFDTHWSALVAGALALSTVSLIEHGRFRARFAAIGHPGMSPQFSLSNVGACFVATTLAYALGMAVGAVVLA